MNSHDNGSELFSTPIKSILSTSKELLSEGVTKGTAPLENSKIYTSTQNNGDKNNSSQNNTLPVELNTGKGHCI